MAPGDLIEFDTSHGYGQVQPRHLYINQYLRGWKIDSRTGKQLVDGYVLGYNAREGPNFVPFNFTPSGEAYEQVIKYFIGNTTCIVKVVGHRNSRDRMNDQIEYVFGGKGKEWVNLDEERQFLCDKHGHVNIPYDIMQETPGEITASATNAKRLLGEVESPVPIPLHGTVATVVKLRGPLEREEDALRVAAICCGKAVLPPAPPCLQKEKKQAKIDETDPAAKYNLQHVSPSPSLLRLKELIS